jgi:transcription elongation factor Elf1
MPTMIDQKPELFFFRKLPENLGSSEFLANSLQSLETSFMLIATGRIVHALVNCVSAIEGALRSANIGGKERDDFQTFIKKASQEPNASARLTEFGQAKIDELREMRNQIVHRGFTPRDNSRCVYLFLVIGFPLLDIVYENFHSIRLYEDLQRDLADHLKIAERVCTQAAPLDIDMTYCIGSFAHLVRRFFQPTFMSDWEWLALNQDEEPWVFWELRQKAKENLEHSFNMPWTFNCPVCSNSKSVVCDLDFETECGDDTERQQKITPKQMRCVCCGYVVGKEEPFISEIILHDQLTLDVTKEILNEYLKYTRRAF